MSQDELHSLAEKDTPPHVDVPNSWPGLACWMVGKFGVGAIFMAMVYFLYVDLKSSNERFARLTEANITAFQGLASRIDSHKEKFESIAQSIKRIDDNTHKQ